MTEYLRFVVLALESGHMAVPSDAVDQAWHQHLTDTKRYWHEFCGEILGQPLHHSPSRGGGSEFDRHRACYLQTLNSYARHFGEQPPADIWPSADQRFKDKGHLRIERGQYWLIRKPKISLSQIAVLGAVTVLSGCAELVAPFHMRGPEFLGLYIPFTITICIIALIFRYLLRYSTAARYQIRPKLSYEEIAYLRGGAVAAIDAAVIKLLSLKCLRQDNYALEPGKMRPTRPTKLESAVLDSIYGSETLDNIVRKLRNKTDHIEEKLESFGLILEKSAFKSLKLLIISLFAFSITARLIKLGIELERGVLVLYPIIICVLQFILVIWLYRTTPRRSRYGDRFLYNLTYENRRVGEDPALDYALFGVSALAASEFSILAQQISSRRKSSSSGDSSGSGWSSDNCGSGCSSGDSGGASSDSSSCGSSGCGGGGGGGD